MKEKMTEAVKHRLASVGQKVVPTVMLACALLQTSVNAATQIPDQDLIGKEHTVLLDLG